MGWRVARRAARPLLILHLAACVVASEKDATVEVAAPGHRAGTWPTNVTQPCRQQPLARTHGRVQASVDRARRKPGQRLLDAVLTLGAQPRPQRPVVLFEIVD